MADPLTDYRVDPATLTTHEIGALVDTFDGLRARKTELNRLLDDVTAEAEKVKRLIIAAMEFQSVTTIGGHMAAVTLKHKVVPSAASWEDIRDYIRRTGEFDLLHKRISETAIKARWDAGEEVPGVERVTITDLSVSRKK